MNAKNHTYRIGILLLVTLLTVSGCQPTSQEQPTAAPSQTHASSSSITHIYAFGDNLSENGNMLQINKETNSEWLDWFATYTYEGRFSNGQVAIEVLADRLNVGLTDYAMAGATSDYVNLNDVEENFKNYPNTGLLGQVDKFKTELNGKQADPDALFFVELAGDEPVYILLGESDLSDEAMARLADKTVANMSTAVTRLAEAGAKQFMVGNAFDWSSQPGVRDSMLVFGKDVSKPMVVYQSRMSSTLPAAMDELAGKLNVKIMVFDFIAAGERIRSKADQYGFKNLTDPCIARSPSGQGEICAIPDEYYYWGDLWETRGVHKLLAEAMAEQLSK